MSNPNSPMQSKRSASNRWSRLRRVWPLLSSLKNKDKRNTLASYVRLFFLCLRDILHRRYRDYRLFNWLLALCSIVYTVSPLDLIPDFIFVGLLDDLTIFLWALSRLREELDRYRTFREKERTLQQ